MLQQSAHLVLPFASLLVSEIQWVTAPDNEPTESGISAVIETFIPRNHTDPSALALGSQRPKSLIPGEGILNIIITLAESTFAP